MINSQRETAAYMRVSILDKKSIRVEGPDHPFYHPSREANAWINENRPVMPGLNWLQFLESTELEFFINDNDMKFAEVFDVTQLPAPFKSPYELDELVRLSDGNGV